MDKNFIFVSYIIDNKEWIFSGVGVFICTVIIKLLFGKRGQNCQTASARDKSKITQIIKD